MGKVDADLGMGEKWKIVGAELGEGQQQSARRSGSTSKVQGTCSMTESMGLAVVCFGE